MKVTLLIFLLLIVITVALARKRSCMKQKFEGCRFHQGKNRCTCGSSKKCTNPYMYKTRSECKQHTRNVCSQMKPCKHGGFCVVKGSNFNCHCSGTGYFGTKCEKECPTPNRQNPRFYQYPQECVIV